MEIKNGTTIDVEPGCYVYNENTDTYAEWDTLNAGTQKQLESLVSDLESVTDRISKVIG